MQNIDLILLKKLTNAHSKTAKEAFYLEAGVLPLKFVVMKRRLMFLHNILCRSDDDLTKQFYYVQKAVFTKHDWFGLVTADRQELKISHTDEEISNMSQDMFRSLVKKAVEKRALTYLNSIAMGHTKSAGLVKTKLERENYFENPNFSKSEVELLFALRTRTVRNIKKNFPTQYNNNMACQVCFLHVCCQEHLLVCPELTKSVNIPIDMEYSDIYGNPEKQIKIVRIMRKLLRTREILMQ